MIHQRSILLDMFLYQLHLFSASLKETADKLFRAAYAPSTLKTYSSAQKKFIDFCLFYELEHLPANNETLELYVAYLHTLNFKGSSIRVYLSAIRNLHIMSKYDPPIYTPRLQLIIRGAVRLSGPINRKLPITYTVLADIFQHLSGHTDELMLKCALSCAFFGCMRAGELCVADGICFDPSTHLSTSDISFDSTKKSMNLFLKRCKTDRLNKGTVIKIGCSGSDICAVCLMKEFMEDKLPKKDKPLFTTKWGSVLTRSYFTSVTRLALSLSGYDPALYSGHSFRSGAATSAGDAGFSSWELKMLGRWSSECYNVYLRNPSVVCSFAKRLVN